MGLRRAAGRVATGATGQLAATAYSYSSKSERSQPARVRRGSAAC